MQINYEISKQDFLDAQKLSAKKAPQLRTRLLLRILPFWGLFVFLGIAWPIFQKGFVWRAEMIVPLLFGTLFLASPLFIKRAYLKAYRGNPTYQGVRSLILNDDDLEFNGPTYSSQLKWQHFFRFVEDEKVFLLYQSSRLLRSFPSGSSLLNKFQNSGKLSQEILLLKGNS